MIDITADPAFSNTRLQALQKPILLALTLIALALVLSLWSSFGGLALDDDALLESTLGRLATWMADQTLNDPEDISSPLAQYAANWATELGAEELDPDILYASMRNMRSAFYGLIVVLLVYSLMAIVIRPGRTQILYFVIVLMLDVLLFLIPSLEGHQALPLLVYAILAVVAALVISPCDISRLVGFFLALSILMVGWEASKSFADAVNYKILLPQQDWTYQSAPSMEAALEALSNGEVDYVIADRKDLDDLMPPYPAEDDDTSELTYQNLRYRENLDRREGVAILPIAPAFPGRLSIAVRAEDAAAADAVRQVLGGEDCHRQRRIRRGEIPQCAAQPGAARLEDSQRSQSAAFADDRGSFFAAGAPQWRTAAIEHPRRCRHLHF